MLTLFIFFFPIQQQLNKMLANTGVCFLKTSHLSLQLLSKFILQKGLQFFLSSPVLFETCKPEFDNGHF